MIKLLQVFFCNKTFQCYVEVEVAQHKTQDLVNETVAEKGEIKVGGGGRERKEEGGNRDCSIFSLHAICFSNFP